MDTTEVVPLAASRGLLGVGPLLLGLVIVAVLIGAVAYGSRARRKGRDHPTEPGPDRPEETDGFEMGRREADELPRDGRRRLPHEIDGTRGTRASEDSEPPVWDEGSSGSFGSGGPGHH
ncbi:DUF6479 family protein [Streptomyces sp. NPDC005438]|uniref:DUF6479 family protein n=1 Tax=Streptomyces sp. NPDC005438 TaxID=3156880 RepID=UPI0033B0150A